MDLSRCLYERTSEPISPLIGLVNAIVADPRNFSLLDSLFALVLLLCAARDNVRAICVIHSGLFLCLAGVSDIILPLPFYSRSLLFFSLSRDPWPWRLPCLLAPTPAPMLRSVLRFLIFFFFFFFVTDETAHFFRFLVFVFVRFFFF